MLLQRLTQCCLALRDGTAGPCLVLVHRIKAVLDNNTARCRTASRATLGESLLDVGPDSHQQILVVVFTAPHRIAMSLKRGTSSAQCHRHRRSIVTFHLRSKHLYNYISMSGEQEHNLLPYASGSSCNDSDFACYCHGPCVIDQRMDPLTKSDYIVSFVL